MKIVWVTNEVWFSQLLRYLFNESVSHVGVTFDIEGMKTAIDINKPTGSLWSAKMWLHKYNIIHSVEINLPHDQEVETYKYLEEFCVNRPYDMNAYYYGMMWGLIHKFTGIPCPDKNAWDNGDVGMCQEILVPILQHPIIKASLKQNPSVLDFSAMTPEMTMHYMEKLTENNSSWKWFHV